MEGSFFTYLLKFLRTQDVPCYFTRPMKCVYPCVEIEHLKTECFFNSAMVSFRLTFLFDDVNQGKKSAFCDKVERLLQKNKHIFTNEDESVGQERLFQGAMRLTHQASAPHEKGKLSRYVLNVTGRLTPFQGEKRGDI